MKTAKNIMLELVAIKSVSETPGENAVAQRILEIVRDDDYFRQNPHLCGAWDGGDARSRPVIWALKRGKSSRTIVFSGHYDTVDTACYGELEPLALSPDALRAAMLENPPDDPEIRAALRDERWMFGRGVADMKSGLAVNLQVLFEHSPGEANILFTAVSDEENLSAGARQAALLYRQLAEEHGLDYTLAVISEPTERDAERGAPHPFIHGSAGKILPVVVARGIPAHSSNMLRGVNSAHLIAGVIESTEYDTAFVSRGGDMYTEPPAVQLVRDMKPGYDVSMPEFTACAFNMTFFPQTDPADLLARLVQNCGKSAEKITKKYNLCFDAMQKDGQIDPALRREYRIRALPLDELERELCSKAGFQSARADMQKRAEALVRGGETMQWATICYIRDLILWAGIAQPIIVAGIAPPYYPAVHTEYLCKDINPFVAHAMRELEREGISAVREEYSQAMMDLSYMSCANATGARRVMSNIPLPQSVYSMDIDAMAALDIPTLVIGPARREIHQIGERVWLPDIERDLPKIFSALINSVDKIQ